jgi:hypothetical protein
VASYDVFLSESARDEFRGLTLAQQALLAGAVAVLMDDPTPENPFVMPLDEFPEYGPRRFGLIWGEITVLFQFANDLVVEVFEVWARD